MSGRGQGPGDRAPEAGVRGPGSGSEQMRHYCSFLPGFVGASTCRCASFSRLLLQRSSGTDVSHDVVTPAKAGVHSSPQPIMDPSFRRDDDTKLLPPASCLPPPAFVVPACSLKPVAQLGGWPA
jgi:hypothetical protein